MREEPVALPCPTRGPDYFRWYDTALRPILVARYGAALARFGAPDGELLDAGAFIGIFVAQARAAGWSARGLEPLAGAVALARQRDIPVERGDFMNATIAEGSLAVLTLWDVLAYLPDPRAVLARAANWLRPGGRLLLRVPDSGSYRDAAPPRFAEQYRRWLYPLDLNQHLVHLTEPDLRRLLGQAGFTVTAIWDDGLLEPAPGNATRAERWARGITARAARWRGLRREMTVLAEKSA